MNAIPSNVWIPYIVALIFCSVGFYKFVWFLSVGYGLAVSALGVCYFVMYRNALTPATIVLCILMLIYGLRRSLFLIVREFKNASYKKTLKEAGGEAKMPFPVLLVMWLLLGVLYVVQTSPVLFRMYNNNVLRVALHDSPVVWVGTAISACAIMIEALADYQKTQTKKANPKAFACTGLYKIVRCPNYFGETLFWFGLLVSSFETLRGAQWGFAIAGYIMIVYIMLNGARRLEKRQAKSYGSDPKFQEYVKKTPIIFPLIPIKSLEKWRFLG